jgi:hypothetical protein
VKTQDVTEYELLYKLSLQLSSLHVYIHNCFAQLISNQMLWYSGQNSCFILGESSVQYSV